MFFTQPPRSGSSPIIFKSKKSKKEEEKIKEKSKKRKSRVLQKESLRNDRDRESGIAERESSSSLVNDRNRNLLFVSAQKSIGEVS
ncbi:hypothetical protein U1Q18_001608 [Sarracenia purpurea var. burkii]